MASIKGKPGRWILLACVALLGCAGALWVLIAGPGRVKKQLAPIAKSAVDGITRPRPPYVLNQADQQVLAKARQRAEDFRRGQARLTLLDAQGRTLAPGTPVRYRLAKHAFGFGNYDAAES